MQSTQQRAPDSRASADDANAHELRVAKLDSPAERAPSSRPTARMPAERVTEARQSIDTSEPPLLATRTGVQPGGISADASAHEDVPAPLRLDDAPAPVIPSPSAAEPSRRERTARQDVPAPQRETAAVGASASPLKPMPSATIGHAESHGSMLGQVTPSSGAKAGPLLVEGADRVGAAVTPADSSPVANVIGARAEVLARTGPSDSSGDSPGDATGAQPLTLARADAADVPAPGKTPRRGAASTTAGGSAAPMATLVQEDISAPASGRSATGEAGREKLAGGGRMPAADWIRLAIAAPTATAAPATAGGARSSGGAGAPLQVAKATADLSSSAGAASAPAPAGPASAGAAATERLPSPLDGDYSLSAGPPRMEVRADLAGAAPVDTPRRSLLSVGGAPQPGQVPEKAIYKMRRPDKRRQFIGELGGTAETEEAVEHALNWLGKAQSADGRWDIDGFPGVQECGGPGDQVNDDVAVTGLSLLAYLGAGYTHLEGEHRETVRKGLDWLVSVQKEDGDLRGPGQMYSQAMGSAALCEAYSMTGDERLRVPAERAVKFIVNAQTPECGWRYDPRTDSDTSVTGWQILALKSAQIAGVTVPEQTFRWTGLWLDKVRSGADGGLYGYKPQHVVTPVMTAEGWFCQMFMGEQSRTRGQTESVRCVTQNPPVWDPAHRSVHMYYWYYATLSLYLSGAEEFRTWNAALMKALLDGRVKSGAAAGTWDPVCQLGPRGGRVYATAIGALCLEVYYRYLPFYKQKKP